MTAHHKRQRRPAPRAAATRTGAARERIVRLAEERFFNNGFSNITMDQLAWDLAMSKKTLYRHFTAKNDLLEAVLDARLAYVGAEIQELVSNLARSFPDRLAAVLEHLSRRLAEIKPPFLNDIRRHAPEMFKRVESFRQRTLPAIFGRLFQEGVTGGWIRPDINEDLAVQMLLLSVQNLVTPEGLVRLNLRPHEALGSIIEVLFEGILTERGRAECGRKRGKPGLRMTNEP